MATKIRRCLYVGLGGTGMTALLNTKKTFLETYGEVPPMIGFLGIDTDGGAYKKELDSKYGKVFLTPNEQLPIIVDDARPIYEVYKSHFNWIPEESIYALTSMKLGAGQVRTNGRFALTVNYKDVENKITSIINNITQARISNNARYELLSSDVEIHMVFSVCGGTGSGTFINTAYLLRKCAPSCKITGYGILPDVFESMSAHGMAKVKPNAYGAVQDLDWLMHLNMNSDKVIFDYINTTQETNERPFNAFFFIDNKNSNNDTYLHVDQLAEMISLTLVTSAGELSTASASVSDNLEKNIREGSMDIENKKAWVGSLGVCEIMYRGEDLKELYSHMAVRRVIDRLLNNKVDIEAKVNAWIDSDKVNIRENNGKDNVIDFLLPLQPKYSFTSIDDKGNPTPEVESYVRSSMPKDGEVDKKKKELKDRVDAELLKLIKTEINHECGVAACESMLDGIIKQVDLFLGEMQAEVKDLKEDKLPKIESSLKLAIKDLVELNGRFFKKKSDLEESANTVIATATGKVVCERDIVRHNAAISFYNDLKVELSDMRSKVENIKNLLLAVSEDMKSDIVSMQNYVGKESQTFQIDLAKDEFLKLTVNDNEILISDMLAVLTGDKIYDFANKKKDEITALLLKYTRQLRAAKELGDRTIDAMLDKLSDEEFGHLIRTAINKSNPLLRFDYKGYTPLERPAQSYYIGVPDKKNSRLCKDDAFKNMLQGNIDVDFSNIGVKDRVIVYRQVGVYPAYCIAPLSSYKDKYDNCNCFSHIDANIYKKMQREDYNLYPKVASDDSLELWVKGFIFNLIKNEDEMYYFRSEELGDALDDNWVELSKYRDDAFDKFKQHKNIIRKEFNEYFAKYQKTKGVDNMQELIEGAKENYYDVYSQIQLTKEEVKQRGNEAIRKLITQELDFVKKEL